MIRSADRLIIAGNNIVTAVPPDAVEICEKYYRTSAAIEI